MSKLATIIILALCQQASAASLPDSRLTPGAILETDPTVICTPGYDKSHRVWRNKRLTAAKYGIPWSVARDMEDDDLVPIRLGGDNSDPRNHWLQPCSAWREIGTQGLRECVTGEAYEKDRLEHLDEWYICHILRTQGHDAASTVLRERQQYYTTNGWAR